MSKNIKFIVYLSVLLSMGGTHFAYATTKLFERNLYFGLRGDDVIRLQGFLTKEGLYNGPQNGNFYALTREGVKKFQQANNIKPATGYFGPMTRELVNNKLTRAGVVAESNINKSVQAQTLQLQLDTLLKQLLMLQTAKTAATTTPPISLVRQPATTTPAIPEIVATSTSETATTTLAIPSSFNSTLQIKSTWADYTMTRFSAVILGEFVFSADEKIAITKLRFKNVGTLVDDSIHGLQLVDSKTNAIISTANLEKGMATFSMTPDSTKTEKGLVVSGRAYTLLADNISASTYGIRYTIEYDIQSESDISAFDYDSLSRVAKLKQVAFPVAGPYIKTY